MAPGKKVVRRKHIPQRTCVICRRIGSKRELTRLVRTLDEGVQIDPTGKRAGRGAYLCNDPACWEQAVRGNALNVALKTTLTEDDRARLDAYRTQIAPLTRDGS